MSEIQAQWYSIWDKSRRRLFEKLRASKLLLTPTERDAQQAQLEEYKQVAKGLDGELEASVKREAAQQERIAELEKQIQKTRDNFYAADRLNIETQKTTTVQFSAMISRYVDQCGDQQERIADLERQIEIGDEALTMLQDNHDGDMEKVREKQKVLHRRCQKAESAVEQAARKHGPSFGRVLANAEAARLKEENKRLREWWAVALDWLQALTANARIIEHYEPSELEKIHNLIKYANEALDAGGDDGVL